MRSSPTRSVRLATIAACLLLVAAPGIAAAHAELETATPTDGATVQGTPAEIVGTYSQAMDPEGSSLVLSDAVGAKLANAGVDPADDTRMAITPVPALAPGVYTVKSTTKSAADGDIDRQEWTFTVAAVPTPTAAASATAQPTATSIPTATPAAAVTPAPSGGGASSTGPGSDVLLPIVAAIAILAIGAVWFMRGGRSEPGQ